MHPLKTQQDEKVGKVKDSKNWLQSSLYENKKYINKMFKCSLLKEKIKIIEKLQRKCLSSSDAKEWRITKSYD